MLADILKPWVADNRSPLYKKYNGYHTGVDINVVDVVTFTSGVVSFVGKDSDGIIVTVKFDDTHSLRYGHLKSASVREGNILSKGDAIGAADRFCHFEYIRPDRNPEGDWPVRIGATTYYKFDPTDIIMGDLVIDNTDVWYNSLNIHRDRPDDIQEIDIEPDIGTNMRGASMID